MGVLRKYGPADLADVLDVWGRASALAHGFVGEAFLERERREVAEVYLPQAETWVWEANGRVAGFVSLLGSEIGGLFVDPDFHRSGIGFEVMHGTRHAPTGLAILRLRLPAAVCEDSGAD